jgi:hypothetical protein
MKGIFTCALGLAVAASTFAATIDISTGAGNAAWQVNGVGTGGSTIAAVDVTGHISVSNNWVAAPAGTSWVSFGLYEATACTSSATGPANMCASANTTPSDVYTYTLTISAAALGATSGQADFSFASDNRVNLFVGNTGSLQNNGGFGPNGTGYTSLANAVVNFSAADLNEDGSLTITAYDYNDAIPACPTCGNQSGFILDGTIATGASITPEPATFGLVGLAGLIGGMVLRRKQAKQ